MIQAGCCPVKKFATISLSVDASHSSLPDTPKINIGQPFDQGYVLARFHMKCECFKGDINSVGDFSNGLPRGLSVQGSQIPDCERCSEADEGVGSEAVARLELEADRDDHQTQLEIGSGFRLQRDSGGACFDGDHLRVGLAESLGENGCDASLMKELHIAVKGRQISSNTTWIIPSTDQRDCPESLQDGSYWTGEECVFGTEVEGPRQQVNQKSRVEQRVRMVGHQQYGTFPGQGLFPLHLDRTVVEPQDGPKEGLDE